MFVDSALSSAVVRVLSHGVLQWKPFRVVGSVSRKSGLRAVRRAARPYMLVEAASCFDGSLSLHTTKGVEVSLASLLVHNGLVVPLHSGAIAAEVYFRMSCSSWHCLWSVSDSYVIQGLTLLMFRCCIRSRSPLFGSGVRDSQPWVFHGDAFDL